MDSPKPSGLICCTTTVSSRDEAAALADRIVADKVAACVQIDGPIQSYYRWEGRLHVEDEFRLTIKTTSDAWPSLKAKLVEAHPYDEPQIIALPILDASEGYRNWVADQVSP